VEFRTRCGIAVWKVKAGHNHSVDGRLEIAAVTVIGVPWQAPSSLDRFLPPRKDGHAVPPFLSMPYCTVSGLLDLLDRKPIFRRFQFLKTNDIGSGLLQPSHENGQTAVHAVDV